ncbi:MAG: AAA family ATPase [Planctomycetaceae bacterium]
MSDTDVTQESIDKLSRAYSELREQMSRVIVGQTDVIDQLLIALFSRGHCMLEGVPGLAKTLMISTLSRCLSMTFARIQFTPDLMPADITGTDVLQQDQETGKREFHFLHGPLFHNVVLADEINRTPPKTQAALLEAMQERQVSVGQNRHILPDPFFVSLRHKIPSSRKDLSKAGMAAGLVHVQGVRRVSLIRGNSAIALGRQPASSTGRRQKVLSVEEILSFRNTFAGSCRRITSSMPSSHWSDRPVSVKMGCRTSSTTGSAGS